MKVYKKAQKSSKLNPNKVNFDYKSKKRSKKKSNKRSKRNKTKKRKSKNMRKKLRGGASAGQYPEYYMNRLENELTDSIDELKKKLWDELTEQDRSILTKLGYSKGEWPANVAVAPAVASAAVAKTPEEVEFDETKEIIIDYLISLGYNLERIKGLNNTQKQILANYVGLFFYGHHKGKYYHQVLREILDFNFKVSGIENHISNTINRS